MSRLEYWTLLGVSLVGFLGLGVQIVYIARLSVQLGELIARTH